MTNLDLNQESSNNNYIKAIMIDGNSRLRSFTPEAAAIAEQRYTSHELGPRAIKINGIKHPDVSVIVKIDHGQAVQDAYSNYDDLDVHADNVAGQSFLHSPGMKSVWEAIGKEVNTGDEIVSIEFSVLPPTPTQIRNRNSGIIFNPASADINCKRNGEDVSYHLEFRESRWVSNKNQRQQI